VEKSSQKMRATFLVFKTLPKVNNHPMGENSPNLVTLLLIASRQRQENSDDIFAAKLNKIKFQMTWSWGSVRA
jgi:hypothetical protein